MVAIVEFSGAYEQHVVQDLKHPLHFFQNFYLVYYDSLYLFDLVEGTLENPLSFVVSISFKLFFACLRFNFGQLGALCKSVKLLDGTAPNTWFPSLTLDVSYWPI